MISFLSDALEDYIVKHSDDELPLLKELRQFTETKTPAPQMLSGSIVGSFLTAMVKLTKSKSVLEIGTFTGYSALCLAEGLTDPEAKLVTLDKDPNAHKIANSFFVRSEQDKKIERILAPALESLEKLPGPFDFVFVDADKVNYSNYYRAVLAKVKKGGVIIFDNCLWGGKILDPKDESSVAVHELNSMLKKDPRVDNFILSIRDGLHMLLVR